MSEAESTTEELVHDLTVSPGWNCPLCRERIQTAEGAAWARYKSGKSDWADPIQQATRKEEALSILAEHHATEPDPSEEAQPES